MKTDKLEAFNTLRFLVHSLLNFEALKDSGVALEIFSALFQCKCTESKCFQLLAIVHQILNECVGTEENNALSNLVIIFYS